MDTDLFIVGTNQAAARGETLTADVAFTTLSLLNALRFPMMMLPSVINSVIDARVSFTRFTALFVEEETPEFEESKTLPDDVAVRVTGPARFLWTASARVDAPALSDIEIEIKKGQLVVVVGESSQAAPLSEYAPT